MSLSNRKRNAVYLSGAMASLALMGCNSPSQETSNDSVSDANSSWVANVEVANPSNFARVDQSTYVSFYDLGLSTATSHQLIVAQGDNAIASQAIDKDFDGKPDGLLFIDDYTAAQIKTYVISKRSSNAENGEVETSNVQNGKKRTQAEIARKVGGEWVQHKRYPDKDVKEYSGGSFENIDVIETPDYYTDHSYWLRYEGPGIESDKVGYRVYLDWRNGFDIFGKTTQDPVLHKIGQDGYDSYHEMQPWGMDILKVGSSLGSGGFGLWHKDKLTRVTDTEQRNARILSNGELYSSFAIDYLGWSTDIGKRDVTANIAMQAGSRLAQVQLDISEPVKHLAADIVKHKNTELIQGNVDITGKAYSYIASWGPQSLDGKMLGMAIFFKKEYLEEVTTDKHNYLAVLSPKGAPKVYNDKPQQLDYFFSAVWQGESGIDNKADFVTYLEQETERLTVQPRLRITTKASKELVSKPLTAEDALSWSVKLANSELARKGYTYNAEGWDVHRRRLPKFEYDIIGLYPHTLNRLADVTGDEKYREALSKITGSFIKDDGKITRYKAANHSVDNIAPGRAVLALYQQTKNEKYRLAAKALWDSLKKHPKTSEGAFWHKKKYEHQLWLDGVYMAMPFLAEYALMFEQGEARHHALEEVAKEFELTKKYLQDPATGFYYHGWDEAKAQDWADKNTGLSPEFWGRGVGWLAMAIIDVLELIPESDTELRQPIIQMAQEMAVALQNSVDDETGTWWQVMDKPGAVGNYRESSATAMFTYFLASAVDKGYIEPSYKALAEKSYQGMLKEFVLVHENGEISIKNICYVAGLGFGRDGSYDYYMSEPVWENDPKGTVPFMLAGIAVHEMLK